MLNVPGFHSVGHTYFHVYPVCVFTLEVKGANSSAHYSMPDNVGRYKHTALAHQTEPG